MSLPLYILRRWVKPGGVRLAPYVPFTDMEGLCEECKKPVLYKTYAGSRMLQGRIVDGKPWHYSCAPNNYTHHGGYSPFPIVVAAQKVWEGNLEPEEYRYWVGMRESFSSNAVCRGCRKTTYGEQERKDHFASQKFKSDQQCTRMIVVALKELLKRDECLVCKRDRYRHSRWGVPICASASCINDWKFGMERRIPFEKELDKFRKIPVLATRDGLTVVGEKLLRSSQYWCEECNMWIGAVQHAQMHALKTGVVLNGDLD